MDNLGLCRFLCGLYFFLLHFRIASSVLCFNCVSTQTAGCGQELDLTLLVKSSLARRDFEAMYYQLEENHRPRKNTRRDAVFSWNNITLKKVTKKSEDESDGSLPPVYKKSHDSFTRVDDFLLKNNSSNFIPSQRNRHLSKRRLSIPSDEDTTKTTSLPLFSILSTSVRTLYDNITIVTGNGSSRSIPKEVNDYVTSKIGGLEVMPAGALDQSSKLVVECPGNTCLLQRIPTQQADVYVRTCDVSDVMSGQCHLATGILGVRVSVVCVCTGDLCNLNGAKGGARASNNITWLHLVYWDTLFAFLVYVFIFSIFL